MWLADTDQAIVACGAVFSVMSSGRRPKFFAWSEGLEESALATIGRVFNTWPQYDLSPAYTDMLPSRTSGGDLLIKTIHALPALFDIGPYVQDVGSQLGQCLSFDLKGRVFGGGLAMDTVCSQQRVGPSLSSITHKLTTKGGEAALRLALQGTPASGLSQVELFLTRQHLRLS